MKTSEKTEVSQRVPNRLIFLPICGLIWIVYSFGVNFLSAAVEPYYKYSLTVGAFLNLPMQVIRAVPLLGNIMHNDMVWGGPLIVFSNFFVGIFLGYIFWYTRYFTNHEWRNFLLMFLLVYIFSFIVSYVSIRYG